MIKNYLQQIVSLLETLLLKAPKSEAFVRAYRPFLETRGKSPSSLLTAGRSRKLEFFLS